MVASDHGIAFVDYLLIIEIQPCVHPPLHAGRKLTFGFFLTCEKYLRAAKSSAA
jgi:hypothetical protein